MEIYGCVKGHAYSTPPFKGSLANCEGGPPGTRWTYNVTRSPGALAAVARLPKRMANGPFPEPGNRALAALGLGVTGSSPELGTPSDCHPAPPGEGLRTVPALLGETLLRAAVPGAYWNTTQML